MGIIVNVFVLRLKEYKYIKVYFCLLFLLFFICISILVGGVVSSCLIYFSPLLQCRLISISLTTTNKKYRRIIVYIFFILFYFSKINTLASLKVEIRGVFMLSFILQVFICVYIFLFSSINYTLVFDIKQKKDRKNTFK